MLFLWCMQLKGNMKTDIIFTGTSLFLPWLLSFWQSWYATVIHIYSETSYTKSVVPVVNSTTRNKSQSPPEVQPEQQPTTSQLQLNEIGKKSDFVTYPVQTVAWSRDFQSTRQPWWEVHSANVRECKFCVSKGKNIFGDLSANTFSSVLWETLLYWAEVCSVNKRKVE